MRIYDTTIGDIPPETLEKHEDLLVITSDERTAKQFYKMSRCLVICIGDIFPADYYATIRTKDLMIEKAREEFELRNELSFTKTKLEALMDTIPDMVWFKDKNGLHYEVNETFTDTVHKTKAQCYGKTHGFIWNVNENELPDEVKCVSSEQDVIEAGHTLIIDEALETDTKKRQLKTYKTPIYDEKGEIWGTVGVGRDITDFENMGLQLNLLIENIPLPTIICDLNYKIIKNNSKAKEIMGKNYEDYFMWKNTFLSPTKKSNEYGLKGTERSFRIIEREISDFFGNISGYCCLLYENTKEKKYEKEILEKANKDYLTGLYNRAYFYEYIRNNEGLNLIYIDIDEFKKINDENGHEAGDIALKQTADALRDYFWYAIAARVGGDEFAIVVKDIPESLIASSIKKLKKELSKNGISISYGVADKKEDNLEAFVRKADQRMYEMKKNHHLRKEVS